MKTPMDRLDWTEIATQLAAEGYVVVQGLVGPELAREWARELECSPSPSRMSLDWAAPNEGDVRYLDDAELPAPLASWRQVLYRGLAPIANAWNETVGNEYRLPSEWDAFFERNRSSGQRRSQSYLYRLRDSEYQRLHQRSEGEHVFPMQLVALLSEPGKDFTGGELVMTEQRPRMQSRPMVVPLRLGDAALIATARRPFKGSHGYYSVNTKHAVSRVRRGERVGLELSFHYAPLEHP